LTEDIEKLSGYIATQLDAQQVVADNRVILDTPLNSDLMTYLSNWNRHCSGSNNVPMLLESLIV
jgi:hypothetical protein